MVGPKKTRPRKRHTRNVSAGPLLEQVRLIAAKAPASSPLPTTRELGTKFEVANTTVFRLLRTMADAGEIWQHPTNGRYYHSSARALLERPQPVACLIRRLELGSELYRELLEGVSAGCGEQKRTMLLWHDELLVNHPDAHEPPRFAPDAQQQAILQEFIDRHGASANGYVLDHIWSDEALAAQSDRLQPAVVLFRSCPLKSFSNVAANFHAGALKALAHLLGRGFERIIPVEPFSGDLAVAQFGAELAAAAAELGCRDRLATVAHAGTAGQRVALIQRLQRNTRRSALLCPEDNIAALLLGALRAAKISCPDRIGVLSVMGTDYATKAGLSCIRYDFRELGRLAVATLGSKQPVKHLIDPHFVAGSTT